MSPNGDTLFDARRRIDRPPHRRRVGLVFQDSQLFPHLSVEHNLLYGFNLLSPGDRRFALTQILDLLDIGHLLQRRPRHLSGGERQRVALGRTLLASPRLLLLLLDKHRWRRWTKAASSRSCRSCAGCEMNCACRCCTSVTPSTRFCT